MDRSLAQWSNSEHCYLSNATIDSESIPAGPRKSLCAAVESCPRALPRSHLGLIQ